jgi:hypothetical protein
VVAYQGNLYLAQASLPAGNTPGQNAKDWMMVAHAPDSNTLLHHPLPII